jgi:hypothetical protein
MLAMDDAILDRYVPVGRHLLQVLDPVLQGSPQRRAQLLQCARDFLTTQETSRVFWEAVSAKHGTPRAVGENFILQQQRQAGQESAARGKKKTAIGDFEADVARQGGISCNATLLQMVYPKRRTASASKKKSAWFDADTWRSHIVLSQWEQLLCLQHQRLLGGIRCMKDWNDSQHQQYQSQQQERGRKSSPSETLSIVEVNVLPPAYHVYDNLFI